MNKPLAKKVLRRAQRYHIKDHQGICKGGWRDLEDFAKFSYLGRLGTGFNWTMVQDWREIGEQVTAILQGRA